MSYWVDAPSSCSISSAGLSPLHAQPPDWWHCSLDAMQLSPHALPFLHTLQHWPVICRHVSQLAAQNTSATVVTHRPIRIAGHRTPRDGWRGES